MDPIAIAVVTVALSLVVAAIVIPQLQDKLQKRRNPNASKQTTAVDD